MATAFLLGSSANAAQVVAAGTQTPGIAPDAVFSVIGLDLPLTAATAQSAGTGALPQVLAGVSVTISGQRAGLTYVAPDRVTGLPPAGPDAHWKFEGGATVTFPETAPNQSGSYAIKVTTGRGQLSESRSDQAMFDDGTRSGPSSDLITSHYDIVNGLQRRTWNAAATGVTKSKDANGNVTSCTGTTTWTGSDAIQWKVNIAPAPQ